MNQASRPVRSALLSFAACALITSIRSRPLVLAARLRPRLPGFPPFGKRRGTARRLAQPFLMSRILADAWRLSARRPASSSVGPRFRASNRAPPVSELLAAGPSAGGRSPTPPECKAC
jgi:hypothetical protein